MSICATCRTGLSLLLSATCWLASVQVAAADPTVTSPSPGTTLTGTTMTFTWSASAGCGTYFMYLGHTVGANDIYNSGYLGFALSTTVRSLPTDGTPVYMRLYYQRMGLWQHLDAAYTASSGAGSGTPPTITSPTSGSMMSGTSMTFSWSAGTGVTAYSMTLGSAAGASDIFSSGTLGNVLSVNATGLPTDGRTMYMALWYMQNGTWQHMSATYQTQNLGAANTPPVMTSPMPGTMMSGTSMTFTWSAASNTTAYWMLMGNTAGAGDIFNSGNLGNVLSVNATGFPTDGRTMYMTLSYMQNGTWQHINATYQAQTVVNTPPVITSPMPGSMMSGMSMTFAWSAASNTTAYWMLMGNTAGASDIFSSGNLGNVLSVNATGLPTDGRTMYMSLYYMQGGTWQRMSATYQAANLGGANTPPVMTSPMPGTMMSGMSMTFTWNAASNTTAYWMLLGSMPGRSDIFSSGNLGNVLSVRASSLPTDGRTMYMTLWYMQNGTWQQISAVYQAQNQSGAGTSPVITSPMSGSMMSGTSMMFTWSAGSGVTQYWMYMGRSVGGADIFNSGNLGTSLSVDATGLPTDGSTLYMRLWYMQGGTWHHIDGTYAAMHAAYSGMGGM